MKKLFPIYRIFFCIVAITGIAKAQLSQGGKPYSFNKFYEPESPTKSEYMPAFDIDELRAQDAVNDQNKGPFRFGYNHYVNYNFSNSGSWTTLADGARLWQLGIKSAEAISLNLTFNDFYLPEGSKLFVYTPDRKYVIGAFTHINNDASNMFATDLIPGSELIMEYYEPAQVTGQGHINLFRVTHGYRGVEEFATRSFGDAGSCQVNVNCPLGNNWQDQKRGVVCLVVGGSEFCTGSLVNDVPQDGKPYVLTANHCSSSNDFASWVFRFNWEAPGCTNPGTSPTSQSLNTSTLRARSAGTDFCLVEITGGLQGGSVPASHSPYFNGWSNVNTPATNAIAIHHPSGDVKKISEAANATVSSTYSSADCWKVGQWTTACTEPGSSGSPLFDQNHHIIGQLYGGPSSCSATGSNLTDYYGKFATSWLGGGTNSTQLKVWLDPNNTGVTTLDGYDPYSTPPAFSHDAGIPSIAAPANAYSSCNTDITPSLTLRNYGADTLTSCAINYNIDGGSLQTYSWTGSLNTNTSTTVVLPAINGLSVGSHTLLIYTSNPNGNTEQNTVNDSSTTTFSIIVPSPVVNTPQTQSFQSTFPATNWTIGNPDANTTWAKVTNAGGFGTSTASARMNNNSSSNTSGQSDYIYSSYLDLTSVPTPVLITFDVAYARYSANYYDSLIVSVTNDCGSNWQPVYAKGGTGLATAPDKTGTFTPTATQWRTETINIDSYIGQSALRIAFENKSGWGQALFIDNINITAGVIPSSVADLKNNDDTFFNVYPNPNTGEFYITATLAHTEDVTVRVLNVLGKVITTKTFPNATNTTYPVDISGNAKGIYFVEIISPATKTVKKINVN